MADDMDKVIEDHEYDGIQELDNHLPTWWLWTFLGAIIFAFLYWLHYSVSGDGKSLDEHLADNMAQIEKMRAAAEAPKEGGEVASPEAILADGKKVYVQFCAACHAEDGGGGVGPNLTDKYWIHGKGDVAEIRDLAEKGILEKGMPAWKGLIKPNLLDAVSQYIVTLKGTTPANPKEPQGQAVE